MAIQSKYSNSMNVKKYSILMVTSEAVPLAKSGGLGDVITPLCRELKKMGHQVTIVMPCYGFIDLSSFKKLKKDIGVFLGFETEKASLYKTTITDQHVPLFLLKNEKLFARDGIYGNKEEPLFRDNVKRFSFLCRGTLELCRVIPLTPDVFHVHDWPGALLPAMLNTQNEGELGGSTSLLTIHNVGYQGIFSKHDIHYTGLSWNQLYKKDYKTGENLNLLKAGLTNSSLLNTVSPTYAKEIQTPPNGHGLEEILSRRVSDLYGVLNGIDYKEWNPETDPNLPYNYSQENLDNKSLVKAELQKIVNLSVDSEKPLIGIISRIVNQKGFDVLCNSSKGALSLILSKLPVQMVILGTGDRVYEEELKTLTNRFNNLSIFIGFNDKLAHLIEGGSDFFLMPSRYEPCGLNQMYSMSYGTIPIVRKTGGLADTVENYDPETGAGTGFLFEELNPVSVYETVKKAVDTWIHRRDHIFKMMKKAMKKRFSWDKSALEYIELYKKAIRKKNSR
ncbi:MAG: glycogen synthase [Spirochaetes bacterium]|nr:MAG: glycogen synthase [Spirochaetota bacterium]